MNATVRAITSADLDAVQRLQSQVLDVHYPRDWYLGLLPPPSCSAPEGTPTADSEHHDITETHIDCHSLHSNDNASQKEGSNSFAQNENTTSNHLEFSTSNINHVDDIAERQTFLTCSMSKGYVATISLAKNFSKRKENTISGRNESEMGEAGLFGTDAIERRSECTHQRLGALKEEIVGCATVRVEKDGVACLMSLAVRASRRRMGVGQQLIKHIVKELQLQPSSLEQQKEHSFETEDATETNCSSDVFGSSYDKIVLSSSSSSVSTTPDSSRGNKQHILTQPLSHLSLSDYCSKESNTIENKCRSISDRLYATCEPLVPSSDKSNQMLPSYITLTSSLPICHTLVLQVHERNTKAILFYKKQGFGISGILRDYYCSGPVSNYGDGLQMMMVLDKNVGSMVTTLLKVNPSVQQSRAQKRNQRRAKKRSGL
eukprot:CAMPEP_0196595510 /NCGR_PEP_ID=MMETSP1081-20130531/81314_1 /TAXON_ID=36882 /ORGANISM="Pyramimonas amylifera, Strain CCMP720" /LENGTH=430 /DNA_ID=CAMNT_0041920117 /DNA_START=204 /DNA_END=1496 /DNA_ORIENTATION=-